MQIDGQTRAIVTGASQGIGRATALALAARGATVGLVSRGAEGLAALAAEIGDRAVELPADVGDREAIESAVAAFTERTGGLELLVANAGIARYAPFVDQDPDDVDQMVRTNVTGTINTVRAGLDPMMDRGRGHIVVVSSGAALRAFPWAAVYGATKAANKGFAEALRHELSGTGVSMTTVFPGEVKTELHAEAAAAPRLARLRGRHRRRRGRGGAGGRRRGRPPRGPHPPRRQAARTERRRSRAAGPAAGHDPRRVRGTKEVLR